MSEYIQDEVNLQNVTIIFQLAKLLNLTKCSKITLDYIARWFTSVVETKNFLELDYTIVPKLLMSSALKVDTEIEIFQAANKWLSYNIEERSKFAKSLLLKVRLPLLSDHAVKYIINEHSSFSKNEDCVTMLKDVLDNKEEFVKNNSNLLCTQRYCNEENSNILICGSLDTRSNKVINRITQIDGNNFKIVKILSTMERYRRFDKAVCLKAEVYFFGGYAQNGKIEKYSLLYDCWSNVADMYDGREYYCICSFMNKIYIFGGCGGVNESYSLNSSLKFDPNCTKKIKWNRIAKMNQRRQDAACAVFHGKIVVSGGWDFDNLNNLETYDVIGNKWSPMTSMINGRSGHSMVVVKNKLFVIGVTTINSEVYDSTCNRFIALKSNLLIDLQLSNKVIKVGNKIFVFRNDSSVLFYDVEKNKWSLDLCEVSENFQDCSIVNIPSV